ncbi:hypothetical protein D3C81_2257940 [compost metagenome]
MGMVVIVIVIVIMLVVGMGHGQWKKSKGQGEEQAAHGRLREQGLNIWLCYNNFSQARQPLGEGFMSWEHAGH